MTKTLENYFSDWEAEVFGYGYGTGEVHTLPALKTFMENCPESGVYNYEQLEAALTPATAWLLINILCEADILDYGSSPRGAWLTEQGKALQAFVLAKTLDELYELSTEDERSENIHCFPDYCNCKTTPRCDNPFWVTYERLS